MPRVRRTRSCAGEPSPAPSTSTARNPTAPLPSRRSPPPRPAPVSSSSCSPTTAMRRESRHRPHTLGGVLCLDAVEISTDAGHYVAIGLPKAPYRLGGEAAAVAEDVRRLGGFGIIAHPDSARGELAWRDWQVAADGVEWLNADSAWRNRSWLSLIRSALGYWVRPGATLAAMLDRPVQTLSRWDATTAQRPMPAFAALDAHGGVGRSAFDGRPHRRRRHPVVRGIVRVVLAPGRAARSHQLADPAADAAALLEALRAGRTYTVIDGVAAPGWIEVSAERPGGAALMGESLPGSGAASMVVRLPTLPGTTIVVLRNGAPMLEVTGAQTQLTLSQPGAYGSKFVGATRRPPLRGFSRTLSIWISRPFQRRRPGRSRRCGRCWTASGAPSTTRHRRQSWCAAGPRWR